MITVEHLSKNYGRFRALNDVSFHIERGEVVGLLGPNGAGKTTTMRILTGYLPPTEGRASIAGLDVFEDSLAARRHIGYLPESVPLYTEMTVRAYLDYMAALRRVERRKRAVERAMARCHIEDRADDLIGTLSKGLRQRVGLAQAIVHEPDVLILDEPTIGLDPRQIIEVRTLIKELGQEHTVILSTHILPEVSQTCSRVLIIHQGHLVAEGTPDELTAQVQHSSRVRITLGGVGEEALPVLKGIADVLDVRLLEENTFEIACAPGTDRRAEIARQVVRQGWDLLELHRVSMSLEEIFLKLTTAEEINLPQAEPRSEIGTEDAHA